MKKDTDKQTEMRDEYDFSGAVRGKYADRFAEGTNVVLLDPDLRDVFADSESVNRVLHAIADVIRSRAGSGPASHK